MNASLCRCAYTTLKAMEQARIDGTHHPGCPEYPSEADVIRTAEEMSKRIADAEQGADEPIYLNTK